ncbi:MAG: M4 family metallopeptidase, partial [Thermoanaerobaculales bacterium]
WLVAEDSSAGAFRDMWNPACFSDPGRVSDAQYFCGEGDNGGVHTNSSIPNHAFALLVDGGTFNGYSVAGIGITKAAHIYWRAMFTYQVPTTDLADHADLLELSCSDLEQTGEPLTDLLTGETSSEVISAFDCAQVSQAMLAVEMRSEPLQCAFAPVLAPDPPRVAANQVVFSESFDTDPMWVVSSEGVFAEFDGRLWQFSANPPAGGDGGAAFAVDSSFIGNCRPGNDDQSGVLYLDTPSIAIPSTASNAVLVFDHFVATEAGWDGGNLRITVNGGPFTLVPTDAFLFNPYNDQIIDVLGEDENANPLAGEPAFSGADEGQLVGSWGQSQIDLGTLAHPGDTIQLRFAFGTDGCGGNDGWYVDTVKVMVGGVGIRESGRRVMP